MSETNEGPGTSGQTGRRSFVQRKRDLVRAMMKKAAERLQNPDEQVRVRPYLQDGQLLQVLEMWAVIEPREDPKDGELGWVQAMFWTQHPAERYRRVYAKDGTIVPVWVKVYLNIDEMRIPE